ncbi:demethoxyubiquinone hydroxylase family protein [Thioalkalivibrio denitrificans]|uniref:3-demethoxyubiquinol 3-hydroxylase n=1 Tax=Thioalkalivibrio denitrificans TaxID=108003 RepID=A0A1V3NTV0_9GAMM|nr:2-polyprenyl-3-methyl-6-methoxy-1,4-benzoquinone monooxygenase [Thioalkalivibrio denitrificans]OOG28545.1 demethoxyubiquinone hydroxylase family protein [Thioalkalivibrio denitrificans]
MRSLTLTDRLLSGVDNALRTLFTTPAGTGRPVPGAGLPEAELTDAERAHAGRLMRVNHAGEVSAQGLYQGQAITARSEKVRRTMEHSAEEENDHLRWCELRMNALGAHKSCLNPLWYAGSFTLGALAGIAGDRWSLGFVAETERQVVRHLDEHLGSLPPADERSRAVVAQMKHDEAHHGAIATELGGSPLPLLVRKVLMPAMSKVMTRTAYWV